MPKDKVQKAEWRLAGLCKSCGKNYSDNLAIARRDPNNLAVWHAEGAAHWHQCERCYLNDIVAGNFLNETR